MLNKDLQFLQWISQRLVNKYNEDPKIVLHINDLISRLNTEISTYKELRTVINESVTCSIRNLQEILNHNNSATLLIREKISEDRIKQNAETFESLEIDKILR